MAISPRVSVKQRIDEFPGQTLIEEGGHLMCQACRKRVNKHKKTIVANHCGGVQHVKTVEEFKKKKTTKQVCSFLFVDPILYFALCPVGALAVQQYSSTVVEHLM